VSSLFLSDHPVSLAHITSVFGMIFHVELAGN